jgi:hypothetical protein
MANLVAGGLGLPGEGSIVVGGLGATETNPNAMSATLAGSSTVTATLTATGTTPTDTGGSRRRRDLVEVPIRRVARHPKRPAPQIRPRPIIIVPARSRDELDLEALVVAGVI